MDSNFPELGDSGGIIFRWAPCSPDWRPLHGSFWSEAPTGRSSEKRSCALPRLANRMQHGNSGERHVLDRIYRLSSAPKTHLTEIGGSRLRSSHRLFTSVGTVESVRPGSWRDHVDRIVRSADISQPTFNIRRSILTPTVRVISSISLSLSPLNEPIQIPIPSALPPLLPLLLLPFLLILHLSSTRAFMFPLKHLPRTAIHHFRRVAMQSQGIGVLDSRYTSVLFYTFVEYGGGVVDADYAVSFLLHGQRGCMWGVDVLLTSTASHTKDIRGIITLSGKSLSSGPAPVSRNRGEERGRTVFPDESTGPVGFQRPRDESIHPDFLTSALVPPELGDPADNIARRKLNS